MAKSTARKKSATKQSASNAERSQKKRATKPTPIEKRLRNNLGREVHKFTQAYARTGQAQDIFAWIEGQTHWAWKIIARRHQVHEESAPHHDGTSKLRVDYGTEDNSITMARQRARWAVLALRHLRDLRDAADRNEMAIVADHAWQVGSYIGPAIRKPPWGVQFQIDESTAEKTKKETNRKRARTATDGKKLTAKGRHKAIQEEFTAARHECPEWTKRCKLIAERHQTVPVPEKLNVLKPEHGYSLRAIKSVCKGLA
ncbi:MAG: hypothetical protein IIA66_13245 [Planctomycetes bacterium]|nr:hypothetical protein [Planctomycetota bacterium]